MAENLFIRASREKYRFPFKGLICAEDLWDLTPEQLNAVYKSLCKEKKNADGESLLNVKKTREDEILTDRIEIVKYIFNSKQAEIEAKRQQAELYAQKKKLREIIASKKNAELEGKSLEELEQQLAALEGSGANAE